MMISIVFTAIIFLHLSIATANSIKYTSINDPNIPPWLVIKSVNRLPPTIKRQQQPQTLQQLIILPQSSSQQQQEKSPIQLPQSSSSSPQEQQTSIQPPQSSSSQGQPQQQPSNSVTQQPSNSVARQPSDGPGAMASGTDFNTQYDKSQSWSLTYANCSGDDHYWCSYHTNQYITWSPNPDGTSTPQANCPQIQQAIQGFEARCCLTLQRYGCGGSGNAPQPSTGNAIIGDGSVSGGETAAAAPTTGR